MIFIPYFSHYSLTTGEPCPENKKYYASKSIEMSRILYLYIRHFFGQNEHIYFSNGASPIDIKYLTDFLLEPYEFISKESFKYNKNIKVHIKQFDEILIQEQGVARRIIDYLKFAWFNNLDYLAIDMDMLVSYNLVDDFNNCDFGARAISLNGRSISSYIVYISKERLHEKDIFINLPDFIDNILKNYDNNRLAILGLLGSEGAYFRNFCYGKIKEVTFPEKCIHEPSKKQLIEFINNYPVKHDFIDNFIKEITNNNSIN